ncbi:MAG: permease prefix domain 1-containing protein [Defluviitaleaceae bacterium]|nr:permease prefix domain 1-containing protein [Defluviitaleaceae bacterium]MCL2238616.1 permease prefix domain 1-containing protein [Defluviitaleaceae bacterium]
MNKQRIAKLVNDLFYDIIETDEVREQKEELRTHLTERVEDYMERGYSFEDALHEAKNSLGDPDELVSGFERKKAIVVDNLDDEYGVNIHFRFKRIFAKLTPLAPFLYIILGITQGAWMPLLPFEMASWWVWGWVIIPMLPILSSGIGFHTITALSPFIYVLLGVFLGWWAWGWMIIPISAILFSSKGKKRRKRKKIAINREIDIEILGGFGDTATEDEEDLNRQN